MTERQNTVAQREGIAVAVDWTVLPRSEWDDVVAEGAKRGIPASKVADAVHHALTASRPKHRYLVGPDAKLVGVLTKLPDKVKAQAFALNLKLWERNGAKLRRG